MGLTDLRFAEALENRFAGWNEAFENSLGLRHNVPASC